MIKAGNPGEFQTVSIAPFGLAGRLRIPSTPTKGIVLFAHGSGSSRQSPRNNVVADALKHVHIASLLFDLLMEDEANDRANVFDIDLLADRLIAATDWCRAQAATEALPIGYFGASTGAAAALVAAAKRPRGVAAIVSRGGRPDLAAGALARVAAPTLLIVGGDDPEVLALNRAAQQELHCESEIAVVPGASHLFEEPGTLEAVIDLASHWFLVHLKPIGPG